MSEICEVPFPSFLRYFATQNDLFLPFNNKSIVTKFTNQILYLNFTRDVEPLGHLFQQHLKIPIFKEDAFSFTVDGKRFDNLRDELFFRSFNRLIDLLKGVFKGEIENSKAESVTKELIIYFNITWPKDNNITFSKVAQYYQIDFNGENARDAERITTQESIVSLLALIQCEFKRQALEKMLIRLEMAEVSYEDLFLDICAIEEWFLNSECCKFLQSKCIFSPYNIEQKDSATRLLLNSFILFSASLTKDLAADIAGEWKNKAACVNDRFIALLCKKSGIEKWNKKEKIDIDLELPFTYDDKLNFCKAQMLKHVAFLEFDGYSDTAKEYGLDQIYNEED